jgi:hypothetical protein
LRVWFFLVISLIFLFCTGESQFYVHLPESCAWCSRLIWKEMIVDISIVAGQETRRRRNNFSWNVGRGRAHRAPFIRRMIFILWAAPHPLPLKPCYYSPWLTEHPPAQFLHSTHHPGLKVASSRLAIQIQWIPAG